MIPDTELTCIGKATLAIEINVSFKKNSPEAHCAISFQRHHIDLTRICLIPKIWEDF